MTLRQLTPPPFATMVVLLTALCVEAVTNVVRLDAETRRQFPGVYGPVYTLSRVSLFLCLLILGNLYFCRHFELKRTILCLLALSLLYSYVVAELCLESQLSTHRFRGARYWYSIVVTSTVVALHLFFLVMVAIQDRCRPKRDEAASQTRGAACPMRGHIHAGQEQ
jgi:hypothetical protein